MLEVCILRKDPQSLHLTSIIGAVEVYRKKILLSCFRIKSFCERYLFINVYTLTMFLKKCKLKRFKEKAKDFSLANK